MNTSSRCWTEIVDYFAAPHHHNCYIQLWRSDLYAVNPEGGLDAVGEADLSAEDVELVAVAHHGVFLQASWGITRGTELFPNIVR